MDAGEGREGQRERERDSDTVNPQTKNRKLRISESESLGTPLWTWEFHPLPTRHILPPSEIDLGLFWAVFTGLEGKKLFHRIG